MNKKTLVLVVAVIALLIVALPMVSAQAATPSAVGTLTITETQINNSFRVTNPINRHITNVHVDLQSANGGQVEITGTYTWRTGHGTQSANIAVVLVPVVSNGRLYWNVTSITDNGQPASADLVAEVNAHLAAAWRNYIKGKLPTGRIVSVTITDTEITFTYTPRYTA